MNRVYVILGLSLMVSCASNQKKEPVVDAMVEIEETAVPIDNSVSDNQIDTAFVDSIKKEIEETTEELDELLNDL